MHRARSIWVAAALIVLAVSVALTQAKAPNFSLKTATGQTLELSKLQGKVVVVNFWATWCGPCRAEIPGMQEVYDRYRGKGLEIVGISLDRDGWDVVTPYVKRMKVTYPMVVGNEALTEAYGGIDAIPTTFIVDKKGNILKKHIGYMSKEEFEKTVKAAM